MQKPFQAGSCTWNKTNDHVSRKWTKLVPMQHAQQYPMQTSTTVSWEIFSTALTFKHGNKADNTSSSLCRGLYALNHGDYYLHTLHCLTRLTSLTYLCTKSVSSYRCSTPSTYVSLRTEHRDKFPGLKQYMASERARNRLPHLVELRHHLPKTEWEWQKGTILQIRFQWAIPLWNVSWKAGDRH
jgi:hypothetical protein